MVTPVQDSVELLVSVEVADRSVAQDLVVVDRSVVLVEVVDLSVVLMEELEEVLAVDLVVEAAVLEVVPVGDLDNRIYR